LLSVSRWPVDRLMGLSLRSRLLSTVRFRFLVMNASFLWGSRIASLDQDNECLCPERNSSKESDKLIQKKAEESAHHHIDQGQGEDNKLTCANNGRQQIVQRSSRVHALEVSQNVGAVKG
jgi:hypothetical protein